MKVSQEILEQIDQHLEGKLSGAALRTFEERLNTDASLKELVAQQQLIIHAIKKKELLDLKKKLTNFHEEMMEDNTSVKELSKEKTIVRPLLKSQRQNIAWFAIAASILFLVWGYFNFSEGNNINQKTIIAEQEHPTKSQEEEKLVAAPRKYIKIPIKNKVGQISGDIQLLITPSLETDLKYTLTEEELNLFMNEALISNVELTLYTEAPNSNLFFIKVDDVYYKLRKTDDPIVAKKSNF